MLLELLSMCQNFDLWPYLRAGLICSQISILQLQFNNGIAAKNMPRPHQGVSSLQITHITLT